MKNPTILFLHKFRFVIITLISFGFILLMNLMKNEPHNYNPDKELNYLLVNDRSK